MFSELFESFVFFPRASILIAGRITPFSDFSNKLVPWLIGFILTNAENYLIELQHEIKLLYLTARKVL